MFLFANDAVLLSTVLHEGHGDLIVIQKEQMMRTTMTGVLLLSLVVLGASVAQGQENAPADLVAMGALQQQVKARVDSLRTADWETLKKAQDECWEKAQTLGDRAPVLRHEAREAYEEARLNSEIAKDYRQQIATLEKQMDQALRDLPEVKDKLAEIQQVEREMLLELQVRTALAGMMAALESAAVPTE